MLVFHAYEVLARNYNTCIPTIHTGLSKNTAKDVRMRVSCWFPQCLSKEQKLHHYALANLHLECCHTKVETFILCIIVM